MCKSHDKVNCDNGDVDNELVAARDINLNSLASS